jgi:hypothetical protein
MRIPVIIYRPGWRWRNGIGVFVAVLLAIAAVAAREYASVPATSAAAVEGTATLEAPRLAEASMSPIEELKPRLIGSYLVTGTDPDGTPYAATATVDIALAPSGALELTWDAGKQVGVGQVVGNVLAVACTAKGRTVILLMTINPDGSLAGKWSRRTDRGNKGTETWRKV